MRKWIHRWNELIYLIWARRDRKTRPRSGSPASVITEGRPRHPFFEKTDAASILMGATEMISALKRMELSWRGGCFDAFCGSRYVLCSLLEVQAVRVFSPGRSVSTALPRELVFIRRLASSLSRTSLSTIWKFMQRFYDGLSTHFRTYDIHSILHFYGWVVVVLLWHFPLCWMQLFGRTHGIWAAGEGAMALIFRLTIIKIE